MCSCETVVQFTRENVKHVGGVVYGIIPVLSGNFSLCEIVSTNFQETYPGEFH